MAYLRRLPKFTYLAPRTIDEACDCLAAHGDEVRLLAGGTDLLLQMRRREVSPAFVIGLKAVPELTGIRRSAGGGLVIGAMTTIQALVSSPLVRQTHAVLCEAGAGIGGPELRNVATVGGNVAGALPCADLPPTLIAVGAKVRLNSRSGERTVPIEDLYPQFGCTVARPDELVTSIELPGVPSFSAGAYLKFHDRQSMDMTTVGVSAFVTWDEASRVFRDVKIALASSAPVPMRARKAEAVLRGSAGGEDALERAALAVCEEADPRTSWRATREFRFELLHSLIKRAVRSARDRAASAAGEAS
jgi:CO/xanthine dehydrogenase FAD-binding subunit